MKSKQYILSILNNFMLSKIKAIIRELRYLKEMGRKDGYLINGKPNYWGRYGSIAKIVELASSLEGEDDNVCFYLPAIQFDYKYAHRIIIWGHNDLGRVLIEFIYSSDQCGSYEKLVQLSSLKDELELLKDGQKDIEGVGYKYQEY